MAESLPDPYREVALDRPNEVEIGGALITMVEPNPGHERAYNRWYEDDHFYSGAMQGPWTFAGRRWVAPKALRATAGGGRPQRGPASRRRVLHLHLLGHPRPRGGQRALVLRGDGQGADAVRPRLRRAHPRVHGVPSLPLRAACATTAQPDEAAPRARRRRSGACGSRSSTHPRRPTGSPTLEAWLRDEHLPDAPRGVRRRSRARLHPGAVQPGPDRAGRGPGPSSRPPASACSCACCGSSRAIPSRAPAPGSRSTTPRLAEHGLGALRFSGTFVPTHVGTDDYVDQLR